MATKYDYEKWMSNRSDRVCEDNKTPGVNVFLIARASYFMEELNHTFTYRHDYYMDSENGGLNEEYVQSWVNYHLEDAKDRFLTQNSCLAPFIGRNKFKMTYVFKTYQSENDFKKVMPKSASYFDYSCNIKEKAIDEFYEKLEKEKENE